MIERYRDIDKSIYMSVHKVLTFSDEQGRSVSQGHSEKLLPCLYWTDVIHHHHTHRHHHHILIIIIMIIMIILIIIIMIIIILIIIIMIIFIILIIIISIIIISISSSTQFYLVVLQLSQQFEGKYSRHQPLAQLSSNQVMSAAIQF